jgi:hypothetical protein
MEKMKTLLEMLDILHHKGYINDMEISDDELVSKDTNEVFKPEDPTIKKVYRF